MLIRALSSNPYRDLRFVTNSWLTNYRKSWHVKGIGNDLYYTWHHKVLEELLPRATTIIACDPGDPDTIYGWACAEIIDNDLVLHYIYVKAPFKAMPSKEEPGKMRGFGVGTALVGAFLANEKPRQIVYTHETKSGTEFLRKLYEKGTLDKMPIYNPYVLYSTLSPGWGA